MDETTLERSRKDDNKGNLGELDAFFKMIVLL